MHNLIAAPGRFYLFLTVAQPLNFFFFIITSRKKLSLLFFFLCVMWTFESTASPCLTTEKSQGCQFVRDHNATRKKKWTMFSLCFFSPRFKYKKKRIFLSFRYDANLVTSLQSSLINGLVLFVFPSVDKDTLLRSFLLKSWEIQKIFFLFPRKNSSFGSLNNWETVVFAILIRKSRWIVSLSHERTMLCVHTQTAASIQGRISVISPQIPTTNVNRLASHHHHHPDDD